MAEAVAEKPSAQPKAQPTPFGLENFLTAPKKADAPSPGGPALNDATTDKTKEPASEPKPAESKGEPAASTDDVKALQEKIDKKEKQLKDTRDSFTQERQFRLKLEKELGDMRGELKILGQKLDGTYQDPGPPKPEDVISEATLGARILTSKAAAEEIYGEEEVQKLIYAEDAPFRKLEAEDSEVRATVMSAKLPVVKAIQILKERADRQKYGGTVEAMRESLKKELQPEIEKQVRAELEARFKGKKVDDPVQGLSGVRGVSREEALAPKANLKLDSIFKTFPSQPGA